MLAREINAREKIKHLFNGFQAARSLSMRPSSQVADRFKQFIDGHSATRFVGKRHASKRVSQFKQFLEGYSPTKAQSARMDSDRVQRFQGFAGRFAELRSRSVDQARATAHDSRQKFHRFVVGFSFASQQWAEGQRGKADRFNVLDVLGLKTHEMSHSRMLAWLLDGNYRSHGTHAQGSLGFQLFLEQLRLPTEMAKGPYVVRREVVGDNSRIDIEIASRGRFVIHIEVKILAPEGADETAREWDGVCKRAAELGVEYGGIIALYLTPCGHKPRHDKFRSVTWQQVATVFNRFADEAQAGDVSLFARHYARTLERFIIEINNEESE